MILTPEEVVATVGTGMTVDDRTAVIGTDTTIGIGTGKQHSVTGKEQVADQTERQDETMMITADAMTETDGMIDETTDEMIDTSESDPSGKFVESLRHGRTNE